MMPPLSRRFFNTTGPCRPEKHYMLPTLRRLPEVRRLVDEERYFVVHAARQTGKTTSMRALAENLRADGYVALHVSLEASRQTPSLAQVEPRWLQAIVDEARWMLPEADRPPKGAGEGATGTRLAGLLADWALALHPRPLVLMLDEVDTIQGEAMVNFLAQLRSGFPRRPRGFPSSIVLVGLRDLKDYLVQAKDGLAPNPGSPFNIKAESLTLRNFDRNEVAELYAQHTEDTGQPFTEGAVDRAWFWSRGQPFLVNALAYHLTRREPVPAPTPITGLDIDRAKEALIRSRTTHLDNLARRLHEPRVARVLRPILLGEAPPTDVADDIDYAVDLGLIVRSPVGYAPANPLYREVLARTLTQNQQDVLPVPWWPWQTDDGRLDLPALVDAFVAWWRRHGDLLIDEADAGWREAAAHLAFMGFLQRVVNGGGRVTREYASGRGRLDLLVEYGPDRFVIELKRVPPSHVSLPTVREEGIAQLCGYLDQLGLTEGWMIVFDQRVGRTWKQRLWREQLEEDGKLLHLVGA
ncbi:MAG: ATP-binding protein [Oligoflexia bacterium]|nr:ATP-binding protein [Oligoflexia bacterium]